MATRAEVARRRELIAELRAQGWSRSQIAAEVGVSTRTVSSYLHSAHRSYSAPAHGTEYRARTCSCDECREARRVAARARRKQGRGEIPPTGHVVIPIES